MDSRWHPRPGDRVIRKPRIRGYRLRRVLGIPGLFSAGYGDVGSSIYYALGVVAVIALGATPMVLGLAGIVYIFNALTYAEGSAMFPEAGGSASFARHAFNRFASFISGWALMLSYVATIAMSAYTIPPYLSYFWPELSDPAMSTFVAMGIVFFLMVVNLIGVRESCNVNILFITVDIATQITLVVLGLMLITLPDPSRLLLNMFGQGNWPSTPNLIFGVAIAALAFTGVETVSQIAEEARRPAIQVPRTYLLMIIAVLTLFAGISVVALSAMTPQVLGDPVNGWARDPVAGIAANLPVPALREFLQPLVAILAATILLTATNAGVLGISRLTFNLGIHHLMPATLTRVHHRFRTPYVSIIVFCLISVALLTPGFSSPDFFVNLGGLYAAGSLLCFALAHASILNLRRRHPGVERPFKLRLNIRIGRVEQPLTAILGLLATLIIWVVLMTLHPFVRWGGLGWMTLGVIVYLAQRLHHHIQSRRLARPTRIVR